MTGERGDVDTPTVDRWTEKLPTMCEGYQPENIFNMDETGLFFRDTTHKSFHVKGVDCAGGKRSKERLTLALCASMTGEKLKLLVIGKATKPRCFAKIKPETLPVTYRNNKKAWMTTPIMTEWLTCLDRKMKRQKRHILLFLDNAPSHPPVKLQNVKLAFLPPNTTSLLQPMDQGIIQTVKLKYRKRQLQHVLANMDKSSKAGSDILKETSVLDTIFWVDRAWQEVETSTIQKCFAKSGFQQLTTTHEDADIVYDEDDLPLAFLRMSKELFDCEFKALASIDKGLCTSEQEHIEWDKSAKEILTDIQEDGAEDDDNDDGDDDNSSVEVCSVNLAEDYVSRLKQFALGSGHCDMLSNIMQLEDIFTMERVQGASKQTHISDFFTKA